jgi:Ca-activated chloride channel homolog
LKIFTIGIGTTAGDLIRITDQDGNSDYVRDPDGNVVKTHLNEALLREIASTTGGFYLPLRGANVMDTLYDRGLAPLPKSEGAGRMIRNYHEWFQVPLVIVILLLLAEMFLPDRKRAKGAVQYSPIQPFMAAPPPIKVAAAPPGEIPPVISAVVLLAFLFLPMAALGSPASALRYYNSGNYTNALQEYSRLSHIETNDFRYIFNAGDAAYRATNFDLAQTLFLDATLAPDINLQQKAYYNLGNTQFRIGESEFSQQDIDLDAIQSTWEDAVRSYDRAYSLNTNDVDAAYNLAFAKNGVAEIIELHEAALRAKAEADEATRRRNYDRALAIMEDQLKKNPTAKQFKDYVKKLKDIDDIANSHQP